jgi:hypothetical protein
VTVRAAGQAEVFTAGSSILVRDAEEVAISRSRPELFAARNSTNSIAGRGSRPSS